MRELGTRLMTAFSRARGMSGRALVCRICAFLLGVMMFAVSAQGQKININYPNRSGSNWPLFIAKEGGYYQKYGLDVNLVFGIHPAGIAMLVSGEGQMVNSSLEQLKIGRAHV